MDFKIMVQAAIQSSMKLKIEGAEGQASGNLREAELRRGLTDQSSVKRSLLGVRLVFQPDPGPTPHYRALTGNEIRELPLPEQRMFRQRATETAVKNIATSWL
jgi:hypothetical protein